MRRLAGIMVMVTVFVMTLCTSPIWSMEKQTSPYKIGLNLSLTGFGAAPSNMNKNGAQLAADEINTQGGVKGDKIELLIGDNKMDASEGVNIFKKTMKTIDASMIGIIGPIFMPIMPLAKENHIPILAPTLGTIAITEQGNPFVFRTHMNDRVAAGGLAKYLLDDMKVTRIAILHDGNEYGMGGKNAALDYLKKRGLEPVAIEVFRSGDLDFSSQLLRIKQKDAGGIFIWGSGPESAQVVKQAAQLNVKAVLGGGTAFDSDYIADIMGKTGDGVLFATSFYPDMTNARIKQFMENFKKKFNVVPDVYAVNAYDSIYLLAQCLEKSGHDRDKLRDELARAKFTGVNGSFTFFENGDNNRDVKIVKWQDKRRVLVTKTAVQDIMGGAK